MVFTPFKGTLAQHALRTFKFHAERDPIILFCCVFGSAAIVTPLFLGDGGRAAENAATSYAFRIKHVYPKQGSKE